MIQYSSQKENNLVNNCTLLISKHVPFAENLWRSKDWKDEGIEDVSLGLVHWRAWLPRPLEEVWQASILR